MFKLVVLSVLLAVAAAKPSYTHGAFAIPAAVSHQSRVDVISKPVVAAYAAAPVVAAAPALAYSAVPAAVSHQSRVDVISKPAVLSTYAAAPLVAQTYVKSAPYVAAAPALAYSSLPAAVSHQSRVDVINPSYVSAYAAAPVLSHTAPLVSAYSSPYTYGYKNLAW